MNINCPLCQSNKVRLVDYEPLLTQWQTNPSEYFNIDDELYATLHCDGCNHSFKETFDIVPRVKDISKIEVAATVECPNCHHLADTPHLPINSEGDYAKIVCDLCTNEYFAKGIKDIKKADPDLKW